MAVTATASSFGDLVCAMAGASTAACAARAQSATVRSIQLDFSFHVRKNEIGL
jgi:hypothetical protein